MDYNIEMPQVIANAIEDEGKRQKNCIELIASENIASRNVLRCMSSVLNNKYAEGYPSHRYYGGCEEVDKIEQFAIDQACKLFKCKYANVQPHSGASANLAVYFALANPGDTILGMSLDAGGHLTHGHPKVTISGKWFNSVQYGLTDDGLIDYNDIEQKLYEYNPRVLVVGASAYSRFIDFEKIRKIVDEYNADLKNRLFDDMKGWAEEVILEHYESAKCYMMVDMAHVAGLVAAGLHPDPLPHADVVTTTTHKTLRGPRGGLILCNNEDIAKKIDKAIFPGCQGGPLEHVIAAKAVCFYEANTEVFKEYQQQVLDNAKAMALTFQGLGVKIISDGTDNHLMLLDLRDKNISGKELEDKLSEINIIVNKNKVVNDPRSAKETSGIRIGTPCITSRGATCYDCGMIASIICHVINNPDYDKDLLRQKVNEIISHWN